MKLSQGSYKRVVIKIGSSILYSKQGLLDEALVNSIVAQIKELSENNIEVVLVSSGAIALGMAALKLEARPKELSYLQAAAAIGQNELMNVYRNFFKKAGLNCGQVLLTWEDFNERSRYLNAKNTLLTLLRLGAIPVINENDTVSTDEIKFGDNDRLSALVASLVSADLLVILSDVDGLWDKDKKVIKIVDKITAEIKALACPTERKTCVGGMITKLDAAKIAIDSGIPCVIAKGSRENIILEAVKNTASAGTLFIPKDVRLAAKDRWIAFGTKSKGKIMVDEGAKRALLNKKSLLSVGVIGVEGNFECGDIISIVDSRDDEIARGKVAISAKQLDKVKGSRLDKEVVHCDNIVLL